MWFKNRSRRAQLAAFGAVLVIIGGVACNAATAFNSKPAAPTSAPVAVSKAAPGLQSAAPAPVGAGGAAVSLAAAPPGAAPADAAARQQPEAIADTSAQVLNRMIIRTAQLSVEVPDNMEQAIAQARAIAARGGGIVSSANTRVEKVNDQDRMVADMTLQVRSDAVDATISDLRALGKVTAESTGSQDVTEEYVDLDSNLRNLQATEAAILKLMDKATQIQDIVSLQRELTNIRGQIERIQGRKTYLERRTDMATITLQLRLPPVSSSSLGGAWDPGLVAQRGWQASLALLRGVAEAVIMVIAFSWWLVPFVALGVYAWTRRRRTPAEAAPAPTPTAAA